MGEYEKVRKVVVKNKPLGKNLIKVSHFQCTNNF